MKTEHRAARHEHWAPGAAFAIGVLVSAGCSSSADEQRPQGRALAQVELDDGRILYALEVPTDTGGTSTDACASLARIAEFGVGPQSCVGPVELLVERPPDLLKVANFDRFDDTVLVAALVSAGVQVDIECGLGHVVVPIAPGSALLAGAVDVEDCASEATVTLTARGTEAATIPVPVD